MSANENMDGCRSSKCYDTSKRISASNAGPHCFTTYGNRRSIGFCGGAGTRFGPVHVSTPLQSGQVFHGLIVRTEVTKYSVSPKQLPGTPLCCSYLNATRCPAAFSIFSATASSRTLNVKICGAVPGKGLIANSPSHVLHIQPFFEIFWT